MPSLPNPKLSLPTLSNVKLSVPSLPSLKRSRRPDTDIVGLDIQPGFVAAVKARVNGSVLAERAAALPLGSDAVRDGEVIDPAALSDTLRELFAEARLGKHVRVGIANQRTVMRMLELPPVTDRKELAAVVQFQAQDQVPMPLNNAVLDFQPLGVIDTPAGPRQRVVLVAAQRDMVEKLLAAVRGAGLTPEGVDLAAFALIRSLHRADEHEDRVLYLNVDGLTNLAIADGTTCRFTRVVGGGVEAMAGELAERRGIPVAAARTLLYEVDLSAPAPAPSSSETVPAEPEPGPPAEPQELEPASEAPVPLSPEDHEERETAMGYAEAMAAALPPQAEPMPTAAESDADVRAVLENGIHEISGEVRNSLDFYRSQEQGGHVSHVVLSGAALDLRGFSAGLQQSLGFEVRTDAVGLVDRSLEGEVSTSRLSVAAGLACSEAPQ